MRVRVKFAKYGSMKFIGHLELMKYLMRAVRRTDIPVKYDEGMHQRMVMSVAMPLGVGPTSSAEYMGIELEEPISTEKAMEQLGKYMCEGLDILDFREVDSGKKMKAMTIVAAADYEVWFREGFEPDWDWKEALKEFCGRESIPWIKETKKGTRDVDMREWIYDMEIRDTSDRENSSIDVMAGPEESNAAATVYLRLCCSVGDNLKPEQLFGEMFRSYGHELPPFALQVHRLDLLTADASGENYISLGDLGSRIP